MKLKDAFIVKEQEEDDDLSPAERALIAKADKDLAKKGVKVKDFDPDKMVGKKKEAEDSDEEAPKSEHKPAHKPAEKAEHAGAEKPTSARGDKAVAARKFMQDNPNATRKQFTEFMQKHGMGAAYANTIFYAMKKKLKEVFYITNDEGQILAEGDVWTVYEDYTKRLMMFKNEWKARSKALGVGGKIKKSSI